jgi:hypothetical protein
MPTDVHLHVPAESLQCVLRCSSCTACLDESIAFELVNECAICKPCQSCKHMAMCLPAVPTNPNLPITLSSQPSSRLKRAFCSSRATQLYIAECGGCVLGASVTATGHNCTNCPQSSLFIPCVASAVADSCSTPRAADCIRGCSPCLTCLNRLTTSPSGVHKCMSGCVCTFF